VVLALRLVQTRSRRLEMTGAWCWTLLVVMELVEVVEVALLLARVMLVVLALVLALVLGALAVLALVLGALVLALVRVLAVLARLLARVLALVWLGLPMLAMGLLMQEEEEVVAVAAMVQQLSGQGSQRLAQIRSLASKSQHSTNTFMHMQLMGSTIHTRISNREQDSFQRQDDSHMRFRAKA
jgi:hypothetical protein